MPFFNMPFFNMPFFMNNNENQHEQDALLDAMEYGENSGSLSETRESTEKEQDDNYINVINQLLKILIQENYLRNFIQPQAENTSQARYANTIFYSNNISRLRALCKSTKDVIDSSEIKALQVNNYLEKHFADVYTGNLRDVTNAIFSGDSSNIEIKQALMLHREISSNRIFNNNQRGLIETIITELEKGNEPSKFLSNKDNKNGVVFNLVCQFLFFLCLPFTIESHSKYNPVKKEFSSFMEQYPDAVKVSSGPEGGSVVNCIEDNIPTSIFNECEEKLNAVNNLQPPASLSMAFTILAGLVIVATLVALLSRVLENRRNNKSIKLNGLPEDYERRLSHNFGGFLKRDTKEELALSTADLKYAVDMEKFILKKLEQLRTANTNTSENSSETDNDSVSGNFSEAEGGNETIQSSLSQ